MTLLPTGSHGVSICLRVHFLHETVCTLWAAIVTSYIWDQAWYVIKCCLVLMGKWSHAHSPAVSFCSEDGKVNRLPIARRPFLELPSPELDNSVHASELMNVLSFSLSLAFCFSGKTELWSDEWWEWEVLILLLIMSYHTTQQSAYRKMELEFHTRTFCKGKETLRNAFEVKTKISWYRLENSRFIFCLSPSLPQIPFIQWDTFE